MVIPGCMISFGRMPSSTAISTSGCGNLDFAPYLSLTESPVTKHQNTFPVEIVTLSSHHRS